MAYTVVELKYEGQIKDGYNNFTIPKKFSLVWGDIFTLDKGESDGISRLIIKRSMLPKERESCFSYSRSYVKMGVFITSNKKRYDYDIKQIFSYSDLLFKIDNSEELRINHGLIVNALYQNQDKMGKINSVSFFYEMLTGKIKNVNWIITDNYAIFSIPSDSLVTDFRIQKIVSSSKNLRLKKRNIIKDVQRVVEMYNSLIEERYLKESDFFHLKDLINTEYTVKKQKVKTFGGLIDNLINNYNLKQKVEFRTGLALGPKYAHYWENYNVDNFVSRFLRISNEKWHHFNVPALHWDLPLDCLEEQIYREGLTKLVLFKDGIPEDEKKSMIEEIAKSDK